MTFKHVVTFFKVLGYGVAAIAKYAAIFAALTSPIWIPALAGFLIFGGNGWRYGGMAGAAVLMISLCGVLAGSEWDHYGHWEAWKWDR